MKSKLPSHEELTGGYVSYKCGTLIRVKETGEIGEAFEQAFGFISAWFENPKKPRLLKVDEIEFVACAKVTDGDVVEIRGYYFDWIVKQGYSQILKKNGLFMSAQGGLLHSDDFDKIIKVNGNNV